VLRTVNSVSLVSSATFGWFSPRDSDAESPNKTRISELRSLQLRETSCQAVECGGTGQCKRFFREGQRTAGNFYPFTLILEKERTAVPAVGWPMAVAGRNVVKISMFFTCGGKSFICCGFDNTR
jgi:hypothetical protein